MTGAEIPFRPKFIFITITYAAVLFTINGFFALHEGSKFSAMGIVGRSVVFGLIYAGLSSGLDNPRHRKLDLRQSSEMLLVASLIAGIPILYERFWKHKSLWNWAAESGWHGLLVLILFAEVALMSHVVWRLKQKYLEAVHV